MTPVGALAFEVYRIADSQAESRRIIHVAQQQKSFAVQQAMVVTDILSKEKAVSCACDQVRVVAISIPSIKFSCYLCAGLYSSIS